jgi:hypothetical protein
VNLPDGNRYIFRSESPGKDDRYYRTLYCVTGMREFKIFPAAMTVIHNDRVAVCGQRIVSPDYPDYFLNWFFPEHKRVRYLDCVRVQSEDLFEIFK